MSHWLHRHARGEFLFLLFLSSFTTSRVSNHPNKMAFPWNAKVRSKLSAQRDRGTGFYSKLVPRLIRVYTIRRLHSRSDPL